MTIEVLLSDANWLLGKRGIHQGILDAEGSFTDDVVRCEEVTIVELQSEVVVLSWMLEVEKHAIVERGFAVTTSEVSVSLLHFLIGIEEGSHIYVRATFWVISDNILGVEDADSNLEVLQWLGCQIVKREFTHRDRSRVDLNPHSDSTLTNSRRGMEDLSVLYWLVLDALPFRGEEAVLKIHSSCANSIISEDLIIVHYGQDKRSASWEDSFEIKRLQELGVGLILLIVDSIVIGLASTVHNQVWVRLTAVVS